MFQYLSPFRLGAFLFAALSVLFVTSVEAEQTTGGPAGSGSTTAPATPPDPAEASPKPAASFGEILKRQAAEAAKATAATSRAPAAGPAPADDPAKFFSSVRTALANADTSQQWNPELVKFLTVAILTFGAAVLAMMTFLVLKDKNSGEVLRLFTVPLVIVASVFLVVTGFSNQQITPVVGLLGTIVGYILGANSTRNAAGAPKEPADASAKKKNP